MLKYNSFRSDRYLRSKFVEGRLFLASEAADLELELINLLRNSVKNLVGDVAVDDAFKVSRLSATELLIEPGEAWLRGLPFSMRSGTDQLVSGAVLNIGIVPAGVSVSDSASGAGKILTFTTSTTPTALYRVVISAEEELITEAEDPFLRNANIPEATGQKLRLTFVINVVTESSQTETPVPYTPNTGTATTANLVNQITVTPSPGNDGAVVSMVPVTGSEPVSGVNLEVTLLNPTGSLPASNVNQATFFNGKLIDSLGAEYHVYSMRDSNPVVLSIDLEVGQLNPTIINGTPFKLIKKDVYVADDTSGVPLGKLFWPVATASWDTTSGFVHPSVVTDLRKKIISDEDFQNALNQKSNLVVVGGGTIGVDIDGTTLHWSNNFTIINPVGPEQTIAANSGLVVLDGGSVVYALNLVSGGTISIGNLAVTSTTNGTTINFSGSPDLSAVKKGNIIKIGSDIAQILTVDNVGKSVTVTPSITAIGSGTIYRDSFGPGTVNVDTNVFVLGVRKGSTFIVANALELTAGHSNAIYDEKISYPSGYTASTNISLPVNTRNSNKPQYASLTKGELKLYVNQLLKAQGVDWAFVDSNTVIYNFNLTNDSEIHFRIDSLPSGSVGGTSGSAGSLQAAYNINNIISIVSGTPVTINGPASQPVLLANGDVEITGVIL